MAFKFVDILLCFNLLRASSIEILLIIISSLSILLGILGIIFIPWSITSSAMEVLFIMVLIFSGLSLAISAIIYYLRRSDKLSKRVTKILIIAVISLEFICFFTLILLIIISFTTFTDITKKEQGKEIEVIEETGEIQKITYLHRSLASTGKKVITIVFISVILALWIILLFLWASEYVRFIFGISGSYKEFVENEKDRQLKHPNKYGLNVIGHDKYGFPIYGKQIGNKIKIKGVKSKFEEKKSEKINYSGKYFDENGKINVKYYSKSSFSEPITQEKIKEKIQEKEKYMEKYFDGENVFQNYTNFENNTILNYDDNNNSINPGYEY
jgi:hypothetical protein